MDPGALGFAQVLFGLADVVELAVHLQQLLFGEGDAAHAQHAGEAQYRKAADHVHDTTVHFRVLFLLGLLVWILFLGAALLLGENHEQVEEQLVVLIVCQTDGVGAHLADQIYILDVMLRQQRIADAPAILMAGYAAQWVLLAVEDEALLRIDLECAAAETGGYAIDHFATAQNDASAVYG